MNSPRRESIFVEHCKGANGFDNSWDAYVLCIVFQKDGPGPRNGAQYGAPFREENWENDKDVDCVDFISSAVLPPPVPNQINPVAESSHVPERQCVRTSESCLSNTIPPSSEMLPPAPLLMMYLWRLLRI